MVFPGISCSPPRMIEHPLDVGLLSGPINWDLILLGGSHRIMLGVCTASVYLKPSPSASWHQKWHASVPVCKIKYVEIRWNKDLKPVNFGNLSLILRAELIGKVCRSFRIVLPFQIQGRSCPVMVFYSIHLASVFQSRREDNCPQYPGRGTRPGSLLTSDWIWSEPAGHVKWIRIQQLVEWHCGRGRKCNKQTIIDTQFGDMLVGFWMDAAQTPASTRVKLHFTTLQGIKGCSKLCGYWGLKIWVKIGRPTVTIKAATARTRGCGIPTHLLWPHHFPSRWSAELALLRRKSWAPPRQVGKLFWRNLLSLAQYSSRLSGWWGWNRLPASTASTINGWWLWWSFLAGNHRALLNTVPPAIPRDTPWLPCNWAV